MSDHDLVPLEFEPVVRERRRILPVFNFLLILALGSGAGLVWWFYLEPQMVWKQDVADVQADIRELSNKVEDLSNRQVNLPSELIDGISKDLVTRTERNADTIRAQQVHIEDLSMRLEDLAASAENVLSVSTSHEKELLDRSTNDHLMFLLQLARNQLNLWNDPKSALRSLEKVDSVLAESNHLVFESTRSEVLSHIQRLKEIGATDSTGVLLRLNVLADKVGGISFNDAKSLAKTETTHKESELLSEEVEEESSIWRTVMDGALGLVKVTSHEQLDVQPLLTPEEQRLIRLRLGLSLERASQAVLRSNQSLYESSLDTVVELIHSHLKKDDMTVSAFLAEIEELRAIRIEVKLPDLDRTIQTFQLASETRLQTTEPKLEVDVVELSSGVAPN